MASHEHNLLPFGTPQSYPLLSAQSKAVSAANKKERLGECHDILCCRTILSERCTKTISKLQLESISMISPTHKRTEGRAPVWGSEFTSKRRRTTGGIQQKPLYRVDSFQARAALTNHNSRVSKNEGAEL